MKNVIFTLSLLLMVGMLTAQQNNFYQNRKVPKVESEQKSQAELQQKALRLQQHLKARQNAGSSKVVKSRWYNAAFEINNVLGDISDLSANNIFPDSTILVDYTTGHSAAWIHSIGECIDPTSSWYDGDPNNLNINKYMPYDVDSVAIYGLYLRDHPDATIVDTLLIQIRQTDGNYRYWESSSAPSIMTDYNTDTLAYRPVYHDDGKFYSSDAEVVTIKLPLDSTSINDTSAGGWNYFSVAPPSGFTVDAGRQLIVTFGFIPGYTWTANIDTIENMNRFRFVSYEENGNNGGMGSYPFYIKWDWTCSTILSMEDLYGDQPYVYTTPYAYLEEYGYEHHWIEVKLTADETGISHTDAANLGTVSTYPNPFTQTTTVSYELTEASDVSLEVYSVTGALLYKKEEGNLNVGSYKAELPLSNLEAGVYYIKINAGCHSVSKKMIKY